jgi:hypothetical protein
MVLGGDVQLGAGPPVDTLAEPVSTTILRDLKKIAYKVSLVILPRGGDISSVRECVWRL